MVNIDNLLNKEDFVKQLMKLSTVDEIITFFDSKGIELNTNDANTLLSGLPEISSSELFGETELSEDELIAVAGGARKSLAKYILEQLKKKKEATLVAGADFNCILSAKGRLMNKYF